MWLKTHLTKVLIFTPGVMAPSQQPSWHCLICMTLPSYHPWSCVMVSNQIPSLCRSHRIILYEKPSAWMLHGNLWGGGALWLLIWPLKHYLGGSWGVKLSQEMQPRTCILCTSWAKNGNSVLPFAPPLFVFILPASPSGFNEVKISTRYISKLGLQ